jgi:hypothetical protein
VTPHVCDASETELEDLTRSSSRDKEIPDLD